MTTPPEAALVGAVLLDPTQITAIGSDVSAADFRDTDLGRLYEALVTLHEAGVPIGDVTLLVPKLRAMGLSEASCSAYHLAHLTQGTFGHHARYYAQEVRKASRLRQYERTARELAEYATAENADPDQIAGWLDCVARSSPARSTHCRHIGDITADILADLRQPQDHQRPVMTGCIDLDETMGGFCPGELVILAARTGQGKTALATQWGMYAAAHRGTVLYCSLEMAQAEVVTRILCSQADVNSQFLRSRRHTSDHLAALEMAGAVVSRHPFYVDDTARTTTQQIRGTAKQLSARSQLALLVVDYIGLVQHPNPKLPKWERVSDITRDLKAMAKDLAVPVLALAQLNREADGTAPRLSHLRDSGSLEQDADVVLFIQQDAKTDITILEVGKHRHAATGTVNLRWIPHRTRFESAAPTGYEPLP